METTTQQLNMEQVLKEAIRFIDYAADNNHRVAPKIITRFYNAECDEQERVTPEEFSLARTIAIGAVTEQEGSNIQGLAAIDKLYQVLEQVSG